VGRRLFHTVGAGRVAADGRAGASWQPAGRAAAIVWSSPEGPRQTPMLAGRLQKTAPYGWSGTGDTVKAHVAETFARLHGKGLADAELDALVRYATTMKAPASMRVTASENAPSDAAHVAQIDRGRHIFKSQE